MFSGIVETIGVVQEMRSVGNGFSLLIESSFVVASAGEAGVGTNDRERVGLGDSIAINGACLTVNQVHPPNRFSVICGRETVEKTSISQVSVGGHVHLERALRVGDRLDGHIVQGHVDGVASVDSNSIQGESWVLWLTLPINLMKYVAVKGSITVDGVSLTVNSIENTQIRLNIVPYTAEETLLASLRPGRIVNIEVDVLARYIERMFDPSIGQPRTSTKNTITETRLRELGFKRSHYDH